jgi:hypothetical protein
MNKIIIKSITRDLNLIKIDGISDYLGIDNKYSHMGRDYNSESISSNFIDFYKEISKDCPYVVGRNSALSLYKKEYINNTDLDIFTLESSSKVSKIVSDTIEKIKKYKKFNDFSLEIPDIEREKDYILVTVKFVKVNVIHNPVIRNYFLHLKFYLKGYSNLEEIMDSKIDCCNIVWNGEFKYNNRFVRSQQLKSIVFNKKYIDDDDYIKDLVYYNKKGYTILYSKDLYIIEKFIISYYDLNGEYSNL